MKTGRIMLLDDEPPPGGRLYRRVAAWLRGLGEIPLRPIGRQFFAAPRHVDLSNHDVTITQRRAYSF